MKEMASNHLFAEVEKNSKIIIYGAGSVGKGFYFLLRSRGLHNRAIGFAVSDDVYHENECMGIDVKKISQYDLKNVLLIIAVKKHFAEDIIKNLADQEYLFVEPATLRELFEKEKGLPIEWELRQKIQEMQLTDEQYISFLTKQICRTKLDFEINLAEHCNLNCQCCNHFSPLAKKQFLDLMAFTKDMERMAYLTQKQVGRIWLLGGEPLLYPQIMQAVKMSRYYFPESKIVIVTNAVLILKMNEDFWDVIRNNNIEIEITKYPISLDYDAIIKKMKDEQIQYSVSLDSQVLKTTYHLPLDLNGGLDKEKNYILCSHANNCITLKGGRIYTCPIAANAHWFNDYFDKNLYIGHQNSIGIYDVDECSQIIDFLKHAIPFCGYCNIEGYTYDLPWRTSQRKIEEWT